MKSNHIYLCYDFDKTDIDNIMQFLNWFKGRHYLLDIYSEFEIKFINYICLDEHLTHPAAAAINIKKP